MYMHDVLVSRYGKAFSDWYTVALKHCTHCSIIGEGDATIDGKAQLWVQGWIPVRPPVAL